MKGFAERIGASQSTVARLEKGDAGVSIGTLAMACLVLGEIDRISEFLDPASWIRNRRFLPTARIAASHHAFGRAPASLGASQ